MSSIVLYGVLFYCPCRSNILLLSRLTPLSHTHTYALRFRWLPVVIFNFTQTPTAGSLSHSPLFTFVGALFPAPLPTLKKGFFSPFAWPAAPYATRSIVLGSGCSVFVCVLVCARYCPAVFVVPLPLSLSLSSVHILLAPYQPRQCWQCVVSGSVWTVFFVIRLL